MQHYIYDASGERVLKASSDMEAVYQNGSLLNNPGSVHINGYTSYPSAFLVITADGVYSKHYYAGTQRIVSRLGDTDARLFEVGCGTCKEQSTPKDLDAKKLQQDQKADLQLYADQLKKGTIAYKEYKPTPLAEQEKALQDEQTPPNEQRAVAPPSGVGGLLYYYHPDHLGTSTALTDFNGDAYQFFLNLPFGETMAQQLGSNYYNSPYKFNGKELDEETGFYYYGARYYDPRVSFWMSVDNEKEKYPNWNPYNYCKQSPISRYDPDGNDDIFTSSGRFVKSTNSGNAVLIQTKNGLFLPSQLKTTRGSRYAMIKIASYYASKIGVDSDTYITSGIDKDYLSKESAANTGKNVISLNTNGGFSPALDNINNFKSVLKHEYLHKKDNDKPKFVDDLSTHADVYLGQMKDSSFDDTTPDFKKEMAGSFANYLMNMDKKDFGQGAIMSKIKTFNKINEGVLYIKPPLFQFSSGTLNSLIIQFKGKPYEAEFKKIKNE